MNRRNLLIAFIALVLGAGVFIYFNQDYTAKWDIPVISDSGPESAEPEPAPVPPAFNKTQYSLSDAASIWVVVNKQRPLDPLRYTPGDLAGVSGGQQIRKSAGEALALMFAAAKAENLALQPLSGYRSYDRQQTVYQNNVNTYGQAEADAASARAGHSEHQTGLAIDIGGGGCGIEDCFGDTAHGKWVATNAYKYGFIIRYPAGKQAITGYKYEPWHIRFVGTELATEMHNKNITTLEEFFEL